MADSNIQTLDTVKPITLDEYQERTAHLQENTTSLLSTIADRQVQAAGLATQAASLASEVNAVAEQASLSFSKKTWTDTATSGTPITATELNRLENAISSLTTAVNNLQDSVSLYETKNWSVVRVGMTVYVRAAQIIADPAEGIKCPYVIPEELRPSHAWSAAMVTEYGGVDNSYRLLVMPDGTITVHSMGGKTDHRNHFASLSYPIGM